MKNKPAKRPDWRILKVPVSPNASAEITIDGDVPLTEAFDAIIEYLQLFNRRHMPTTIAKDESGQ